MSPALSPPAVTSADDLGWTTQRRLLDVVIVLGIALRLIQYCASVSVWLDEASLALDVRESSLIALLIHPLARLQIAPKGFLLVQGIIFRLAGDGEYALRFFPLGCSILGLLLFRRLALRALEPGPAVIATLGFALASPLIRFAAEGKPYGLDATAAILLTLVALHVRDRERPPRNLAALALASGCVAWFSVFATFVLTGLGVSLVLIALLQRDRRATLNALLVSAIWGATVLAVTVVSIKSMTPDTRDFMGRYWHESMLPSPVDPLVALRWLGNSLAAFISFTWRTGSPRAVTVICALGFLALWRRSPNLALMLAMPLVVAIGAAIARQYPLFQRLMLGMVPSICLSLAASAGWVTDRVSELAGRWHAGSTRLVRGTVLAGFAIPLLSSFSQRLPPYRVEEIKPLLAYIREHQRPGDAIITHYAASAALQYYAPFYGFERFISSQWPASDDDDSATVPGLDSLAGQSRAWLVFVGNSEYLKHRLAIFEYLNRTGVVLDSVIVRLSRTIDPNAEAYLYDFTRRP
jgi:hypothetical protein